MSDDLVKRARAALDGATPGPWIGCNMIHADRGDEMTPEEIGEYVTNSVKMGDKSQFLFISGKHDDGEDCDICHTGNGPRGDKNTRFIAASRELVPAMADRIEELEAKLAKAVEALEFYATRDVTYHSVGTVTFHGHDDSGRKARTTLVEINGGGDT